MLGSRWKKLQNAQGMVEFALVMPILLLVILGIFAFGHFFFSYSTVVSASREAARYGAVVGLGSGGRLRYQDCSGIRATAARIGGFAGVAPVGTTQGYTGTDTGVYIGYDKGPDSGAPYDVCPDGGVGPLNVDLGDRILVRVTIMYRPIVPLVEMPTFPLSATTARTIVKSLAVGDAPTAVPGCYSTAIRFWIDFTAEQPAGTPPWNPWVGQPVIPYAEITASDGSIPTGTVMIYDQEDPSISCTFNIPFVDGTGTEWGSNEKMDPNPCLGDPYKFVYSDPGVRYFTVEFAPTDEGKCYQPNAILGEAVEWVKADTITEITDVISEPSVERESFTVNFRIRAVNPGAGVPSGRVIVYDSEGQICDDRNVTQVDAIYSVGSCRHTYRAAGVYSLYAMYLGDDSYNQSDSRKEPYEHVVFGRTTPTLLPTTTPNITRTPTATPTSRPTNTPIPPIAEGECPSFTSQTFSKPSADTLSIGLNNPGTYDFDITRISVNWPGTSPTALLKNISFGGGQIWHSIDDQTYMNPNNAYALDPTVPVWNGSVDFINKNETKDMGFAFSSNLLSGVYSLTVDFRNAYGQTCSASLTETKP